MANEIPNMSLKQATFNQGSFTPATYTPQMADVNILANSLSKMEARQEKAAEKQGAVDSALAKVESQLHNDKDTQQWFSNYKDNIQKQIQSQVDVGDYGNAIRVATKLADKVMLDPAVQGRLKAEEKYQQEVKTQQARRDNKEISQDTYDWWLSSNPYKYEDNYDSNGNIIGGTDYTPKFRPVADIKWAAVAKAAFDMITPYKYSNARDHAENNNSNGIGTFKSTSWHKTYTYQHVKEEDILKNIESIIEATTDGDRQVEQAFDVAMYQLDKMEKEYAVLLNKDPYSDEARNYKQKLDKRRRLMTKNGSPIDYKEYYARMVTDNMFAKGLAYDWRTVNTGNTTSTNTNVDNNSGGSGTPQMRQSYVPFEGATLNPITHMWEGPNVQQIVDTNTPQNVVTQSQSSITNRFDNKNKKH